MANRNYIGVVVILSLQRLVAAISLDLYPCPACGIKYVVYMSNTLGSWIQSEMAATKRCKDKITTAYSFY